MSHSIRPIHRLRLLAILCAVAIPGTGTLLVAPPAAQACPSQQIEYTFYTDGTYSVPCGSKIISCICGSGAHSSGCVTDFYTIDYYDC